MVQTIIKKSQAPLDSRDLEICQHVFDDLRTMADVPRNSEEAERIAAIVVELYRQGVRNPEHLKKSSLPRPRDHGRVDKVHWSYIRGVGT